MSEGAQALRVEMDEGVGLTDAQIAELRGNGYVVVPGAFDRAEMGRTILVSIDDADEANGCLEFAPGLHRQGLIGEMWAPLGEDDPRVRYHVCPTRRGDAVFFDSFAPHRSGPNRSDGHHAHS